MKEWGLWIAFFLLCGGFSTAQEKDRAADEASIRKNLETYVTAYREKDAGALASLWSESGNFTDPVTGEPVKGKKAIEEAYRNMLEKEGDAALEVEIESLRFLTEEVAVEEGSASVARPGELPVVTSYQAIHVKQGGKWLIDSVRETFVDWGGDDEGDGGQGGEELGVAELKEMEWMIGDWIDAGEDASVEMSCSWGMGKSFIRRDFAVVVKDRVELDGIEVVGWDPHEKNFRSWVFDSGGGFGSAIWEKGAKEGEWLKKLSGTTREGKKVYSVHMVRPIDENSFGWSAHGRVMDGEILPNISEVIVTRLTGE